MCAATVLISMKNGKIEGGAHKQIRTSEKEIAMQWNEKRTWKK